ncbi:hypothetical protein [Paractinoplanes durhamensis]|uniref:Lipoprotein n=1 Tax=Paractinoplanes durhamensis TaxID=113563 RepID=A0ABQ3Z179_9ACTN|nr:hypothetical protein [Actinoplanes durhamensis]GIE03581.1 hypothetical protein Adu01nite_49310 [Actinoplanes durhamensis]
MNGKLVVAAMATVALGGCGAQATPTSLPSSTTPATSSAASSAAPSLAAPTASSPAAARSSTSTAIPVSPLTSGPPKGPTDQIKATDWVVGTVTGDSSGPCYGLETDDGKVYALHATGGAKLAKGARIRIKTAPAKVKMYCGPGTFLEMVESVPLR